MTPQLEKMYVPSLFSSFKTTKILECSLKSSFVANMLKVDIWRLNSNKGYLKECFQDDYTALLYTSLDHKIINLLIIMDYSNNEHWEMKGTLDLLIDALSGPKRYLINMKMCLFFFLQGLQHFLKKYIYHRESVQFCFSWIFSERKFCDWWRRKPQNN